MKKYVEPEMEIVTLKIEDIVVTSTIDEGEDSM